MQLSTSVPLPRTWTKSPHERLLSLVVFTMLLRTDMLMTLVSWSNSKPARYDGMYYDIPLYSTWSLWQEWWYILWTHSGTRHLKSKPSGMGILQEFLKEPISIHDVWLCTHIWWWGREGDSLACCFEDTQRNGLGFSLPLIDPQGSSSNKTWCGSYAQYTNRYYRSMILLDPFLLLTE